MRLRIIHKIVHKFIFVLPLFLQSCQLKPLSIMHDFYALLSITHCRSLLTTGKVLDFNELRAWILDSERRLYIKTEQSTVGASLFVKLESVTVPLQISGKFAMKKRKKREMMSDFPPLFLQTVD